MRKRNFAVAGLLAVALTATIALAQQPTQVTIEKCADTQGAVAFDHATHASRAENCGTCHHNQPDLTAESTEVENCRSCHLNPTEGVLGCTDRSPSANAYHALCMGCHRTASREEGVSAPIRCNGCHAE
jgi:hypothetical protein